MSVVDSGENSALVEVAWLLEHRSEVVILDASIRRGVGPDEPPFASGREAFSTAHIPGARFADLFEDFSDPGSELPFTRPTDEGIARAAARVGIDSQTPIVVYDRLTGAWAARVWWVLRSRGFSNVRVLNGGFDAWIQAGGEVESGASETTSDVTRPDRPVLAETAEGWFVDIDRVTDAPEVVLCALNDQAYRGDPDEPGTGHIPGSLSAPYASTLVGGRIDPSRTRALPDALGIGPDTDTIIYCGGGINAAGLALAFHEVGLRRTAVYDGSLADWRSDPERPLVTGPFPFGDTTSDA